MPLTPVTELIESINGLTYSNRTSDSGHARSRTIRSVSRSFPDLTRFSSGNLEESEREPGRAALGHRVVDFLMFHHPPNPCSTAPARSQKLPHFETPGEPHETRRKSLRPRMYAKLPGVFNPNMHVFLTEAPEGGNFFFLPRETNHTRPPPGPFRAVPIPGQHLAMFARVRSSASAPDRGRGRSFAMCIWVCDAAIRPPSLVLSQRPSLHSGSFYTRAGRRRGAVLCRQMFHIY